jgi:hypothetical protein
MIPASRVALVSSIQVNDRGKAGPAVPYRGSDLVLWPEPEATLAAGGVRCLGSTCRRSVGPNPPLVTRCRLSRPSIGALRETRRVCGPLLLRRDRFAERAYDTVRYRMLGTLLSGRLSF